jgi:hypothetical protein
MHKAVLACFKALSKRSHGQNEETHKNQLGSVDIRADSLLNTSLTTRPCASVLVPDWWSQLYYLKYCVCLGRRMWYVS